MSEQFIQVKKEIYNIKYINSIYADESPTCLAISTAERIDYVEYDSERERDDVLEKLSTALDVVIRV